MWESYILVDLSMIGWIQLSYLITQEKTSSIDADVSKDIRIKRMDHKVYKYTCFYTLKEEKS